MNGSDYNNQYYCIDRMFYWSFDTQKIDCIYRKYMSDVEIIMSGINYQIMDEL